LDFIRYARSMQGRKADALRAANFVNEANAPMAQAMPEMADPVVAVVLFTHLRFQDWDYVLNAAQPNEKMKVGNAMWRYARAIPGAARRDRTAALQERDAFTKAKAAVQADGMWGQNKVADVLAMASETLAARLAASPAEAVPHWQRAVEMQDALTYDEPPAWYYPLRESWGAAVLRAGKAADAEKVFREGVKRSPRNGRMLFGLLESLKAQQKTEDAGWVQREFDAVWAKADVKLRVEDL
jgi:hypothetical protein